MTGPEPANNLPATPDATTAPGAPFSRRLVRALADYGILLFLIVLVVYFNHATHGLFGQPANLRNIGLQVAVNAILSVGMTYVIITAGIDLSVGSVVGFVGIVVANTLMNGFVFAGHTYMAPLALMPGIALVFLVAIVLGGLIGAFNGLFVTKWNVPPFIVTLAMFTAARGLANVYTNAEPIGPLPDAFNVWGGPRMIFIALIIVIVGDLFLRRSRFGRFVYAVGGNEEAARLSGIPVKKVLMQVYILMGVLAGLAGLLQSARLGSGDPQAGILFELNAIAAVVLGGTSLFGGRGTVVGTLIGVLVIGVLETGLQLIGVPTYWQQVAKGAVILAAVVLDQVKERWMQKA